MKDFAINVAVVLVGVTIGVVLANLINTKLLNK